MMVEAFGNFLHDEIDQVEQNSTVEAYHQHFEENSLSCSINKAQVSVNPVKDDLPMNVVCAENLPTEKIAFGTDVEYSSCTKENGGQCAISKATSYVIQSDKLDKIRDKGGTVVPRDSVKSDNRYEIHFNILLTQLGEPQVQVLPFTCKLMLCEHWYYISIQEFGRDIFCLCLFLSFTGISSLEEKNLVSNNNMVEPAMFEKIILGAVTVNSSCDSSYASIAPLDTSSLAIIRLLPQLQEMTETPGSTRSKLGEIAGMFGPPFAEALMMTATHNAGSTMQMKNQILREPTMVMASYFLGLSETPPPDFCLDSRAVIFIDIGQFSPIQDDSVEHGSFMYGLCPHILASAVTNTSLLHLYHGIYMAVVTQVKCFDPGIIHTQCCGRVSTTIFYSLNVSVHILLSCPSATLSIAGISPHNRATCVLGAVLVIATSFLTWLVNQVDSWAFLTILGGGILILSVYESSGNCTVIVVAAVAQPLSVVAILIRTYGAMMWPMGRIVGASFSSILFSNDSVGSLADSATKASGSVAHDTANKVTSTVASRLLRNKTSKLHPNFGKMARSVMKKDMICFWLFLIVVLFQYRIATVMCIFCFDPGIFSSVLPNAFPTLGGQELLSILILLVLPLLLFAIAKAHFMQAFSTISGGCQGIYSKLSISCSACWVGFQVYIFASVIVLVKYKGASHVLILVLLSYTPEVSGCQ